MKSKRTWMVMGLIVVGAMVGCEVSPEMVDMATELAGGAAGKAAEGYAPGTGYAAAGLITWAAGRIIEALAHKGYVTIKKKKEDNHGR